jgi:hypothetical protein
LSRLLLLHFFVAVLHWQVWSLEQGVFGREDHKS